jgi:hypothetical protein
MFTYRPRSIRVSVTPSDRAEIAAESEQSKPVEINKPVDFANESKMPELMTDSKVTPPSKEVIDVQSGSRSQKRRKHRR